MLENHFFIFASVFPTVARLTFIWWLLLAITIFFENKNLKTMEQDDFLKYVKGKDGFYETQLPPSGWGKRHTQIILGASIIGTGLYVTHNLSIAMVAMTDNTRNSTTEVYNWDKKTQSFVMSAFFLGYTLMLIPFGIMSQRFGAKIPLGVALATSTLISFAFPPLIKIGGWHAACVCRFLLGMALAAVLPCIGSVVGKWIPLPERGRAFSYGQAGGQFGKVAGIAISGWLAVSPIGWPLIFYVSGMLTLALVITFVFLGKSSPDHHSTISRRESEYIKENTRSDSAQNVISTPWRTILCSVPVLVIMLADGGYTWFFATIIIEMPSYMKNILGEDIKSSALLSALPYLAMGVTSVLLGNIIDYFINTKIVSVTTGRKISNTIGMWLSAGLLVIFSYIPASQPVTSVAMLVLCMAFVSGINSGFPVMAVDIAPNFAGITTSLTTTFGNLCAFTSSLVTGMMITDVTDQGQWRTVFCLSATVMFVANLILLVFGTSELQSWNSPVEIMTEYDKNPLKKDSSV